MQKPNFLLAYTRSAAILLLLSMSASADSSFPLNGRWTNGRLSMIQYRDAYTGVYRPPSGSHFAYEFRPDGTYTFVGLIQNTMYNCTTSMFSEETGTYEWDGGSNVSLHPRKNPYKMTNSCSTASTREAPGRLVERTYRFQVQANRLEFSNPAQPASGVQTFQRSAE